MTLYFVIRFTRDFTENSFLSFYATDLLFVPAAGLFSLFFVRIIKRNSTILIPWYYILLFVLFTCWYFEFHLPSQGFYIYDDWDIVMYFFGGIIFYFLQKRTVS